MGREKIFIKDSAIKQKEHDAFSYIDYVRNLKRIIEDNDAPFNIAIIGKWGVGKSSIINLLKEELSGKSEYIIQEINAWKYENTFIKRAFIKHLYKKLNGDKDDLVQNLKELLKPSIDIKENEESTSHFIKKTIIRIAVFLGSFVVLSLILYLLLMIFDLINLWISGGGPLSELWNNYVNVESKINIYETIKSFKEKMFIPLALLGIGEIAKLIIAYKSKKIVRYEINPAIEGTDEYEEQFVEALSKYKNENKHFKKLIVVIDDLDRLSPKKIVDALDAIKAFVDVEECIFIVPFDDSILRKAINSKKSNELTFIDGDSYLDKLFQFKLILPPLIDMDMKEYACNLCRKEIPEIFNLCPSFETIIQEILIYPYVSTPRQIVKIINTFISNILIVKNRENKKLEANLITNNNGLNMLAKISVLQSDFPEFYECLLQDNDLISKVLEKYYSNTDSENVDYMNDFGVNGVETLNALIGFLTKTEYIYSENLAPFIYLGQDSLGLSAGDKKQRSIRKELLSGNDLAISKYSKNGVLSDIDTKIIIQGINEAKTTELQYALKVAIQIINNISEEFVEEFANLISNKINIINEINMEFRYWQANLHNYLVVYKKASNRNGIEGALHKIIDLLFEKNEEWKQKNGAECTEELFITIIQELIDECFCVENILSKDIKSKLKGFINNSDYPLENIIIIYNKHKNLIKDYFADNFYSNLCKYLGTKEDIENEKEIMQALNEIAVVVREEDIERFSEPLTVVIRNELNALNVCDLLEPVATEISVKNATNLINEFISFDYSEKAFKTIVKIVIDLKWNFSKIKNEQLNSFIIKGCDYMYIDDVNNILSNKILSKQYNTIDKAIEYISNKCLINGSYDKLYNEIIINFTVEQIQFAVEKVKEIVNAVSTTINIENFKRCVDIIKLMLKNKESHKLLSDMVSDAISLYGNVSYLRSYQQWLEAYTEIIGVTKNIISETKFEEYTGLLINQVISYDTNIMIKGLYYIGRNTPKVYVKECIDKIILHSDNFDKKIITIKYLKEVEEYITKENNNISTYAMFLVNCIDTDTNTVLQNLNSYFGKISKENLCKIINYLMSHSTYDKNLALNVINEFFNKIDKSECIRDILLNKNEDISFEFICDIISNNGKIVYQEILNKLVSDITNQDTMDYLFNLLLLTSYYKDIIDKKLVATIVDYIWISCTDNELIKLSEILNDNFNDFKFKNAKSILNKNIVEVFRKSNIEAKRSVLNIAKMFDFNRTFKDASKVEKFTDNEKELLKDVLKIA